MELGWRGPQGTLFVTFDDGKAVALYWDDREIPEQMRKKRPAAWEMPGYKMGL
jgi:hypothetical protein